MRPNSFTAILAAGGTGGHMFPAQMVAERLREKGWKVILVTDERGIKHTDYNIFDHVETIKASTISLKKIWQAPYGFWKILHGFFTARKLLKSSDTDIIVGFGGYPVFPVLAAARSLKIPFILQEQNTVLGRANRIFARKAEVVACGFKRLDHCPKNTKTIYTGNPVRQEILDIRDLPYTIPKTPEEDFYLLVLGGSLGARLLGETVPKAILKLPESILKNLIVIQQTRAERLEIAKELYRQAGVRAHCAPFFENIETYLAQAHLVIARSGASTVSELMITGRPSILIPLLIAMDDHQTANASLLMQAEAANIITERAFTPERLTEMLLRRLSNPSRLEVQARNARELGNTKALENIVLSIEKVVEGIGKPV